MTALIDKIINLLIGIANSQTYISITSILQIEQICQTFLKGFKVTNIRL